MPVATLAEAPRFERGGAVFRPLAVPSRGSAELAVWLLELEPGLTGEEHSVSREEVFVLQSGVLELALGGEVHRLAPGDAVIVAPDTLFRLDNPGAEPARSRRGPRSVRPPGWSARWAAPRSCRLGLARGGRGR